MIDRVDVGGGVHLAYRIWGESGPPLLLLHGITSSSLSWVRVGPALAQQFRVVAPDLKGHGDSDKPPTGYGLETQMAEIAWLCERLGLSALRVIGHSWGGAIALLLATHTGLVHRLVLEDPALHLEPAGRVRFSETFSQQVGLSEAEAEARIATVDPRWTEADRLGKIDAATKGSPVAVRAVFAENDPWNLSPLLRLLRCPTLLQRAAIDLGGIVSDETAHIAAGVPGVEVELIPRADHNIHRTEFDAFIASVQRFLPLP